jgi:hypothetical protein
MHIIGRRNFLAGLGLGAGSHLLGSMFRPLLAEAQGQPARKHLFLFTAANGLLERFYTCPSRSETDFDLGPAYEALVPYKARLVVASKFFNPYSKALHGNQMATLTVMESPDRGAAQQRGGPGGISIDRLIGKAIGAGDPFSSTAVGCTQLRTGGDPNRALCVSADGLKQPFPAFGSPAVAFREWFGAKLPGAPGGMTPETFERTLGKNRSFIDLIAADVTRMKARLGGPERAKLDQYLESLAVVEKEAGQRTQVQAGCTGVMPPALAAGKGAVDEGLDPEVLDRHIDVTHAAHMCGLTRVSHISIEGMEGPHAKYSWLGDPKNHHDDHHANDNAILQKIVAYWFSKMARLADLLAKTPEGGGTMLDNSVIVFINTCGGAHHRGHESHPLIMLAGEKSGLRGGRYLKYNDRCISDAYVSLANVFLPTPIATFGNPAVCKGPLPGFA